MGQITIDYQVVSRTCDHCHEKFDVSRGAVYDDGEGFSLYLAGMHKCYYGRLVHLAIAIRGGYKEFQETCAVAVQVAAAEVDFEMFVVDAKDSPWRGEEYLGRMLDREEALESPLIGTFFHTADHIVADNPKVHEYLSGS